MGNVTKECKQILDICDRLSKVVEEVVKHLSRPIYSVSSDIKLEDLKPGGFTKMKRNSGDDSL